MSALDKVVPGECAVLLAAAAKAVQGWNFADALHHAQVGGCVDFVTLDADLAKCAKRGAKLAPVVTKL